MSSKNSVKVTLRAKDYDPGQSNWQTEKHQKDNCPIIENGGTNYKKANYNKI